MSRLYLSPTHGVNPSVMKCFFCLEDKGVALLGRLKEDKEAPREGVYDFEPCEKCAGYMKQGIILISVDEKKSASDFKNPYRTGGWVVVKEEAVRRFIKSEEILQDILSKRVAFLPDEVWDAIGLPRGNQ